MSTQIQTRQQNPVVAMSNFLDKLKPQMALALPKHMNANRMTRLALTAFSTNEKLQQCTHHSIAGAIMTAAQMGLEPGINGQGYLVAYKNTCTFVPGWKGLVDIANRSGRCTVWTGAVFEGDEFDYALGDNPFVRHRPGDEDDASKMTHVYAVGRVVGSTMPVIEVWTIKKIWKHRNKYNKVGNSHYSFRDPEMYARKVPLLQVLKYMPSSIELNTALEASNAAEEGRSAVIDGSGFVTISEPDRSDEQGQQDPGQAEETGELPVMTQDAFNKKKDAWRKLVENGRPVNAVIAMAQTKEVLTDEMRMEIASWSATQMEA